MFAGTATRDNVIHNLNSVGNVMDMQQDAHTEYDDFALGIEAKQDGPQPTGATSLISRRRY